MSRVKTGTSRHRKHKKVLNLTKGYRGANTRLIKRAKEAMLHAGQYAFVGRKRRKRDMRKLWIIRINAAARINGTTYSQLMHALDTKGVVINRKVLASLAVENAKAFADLVSFATN